MKASLKIIKAWRCISTILLHSAPGHASIVAVIIKYFDADHKMFGLLMEGAK